VVVGPLLLAWGWLWPPQTGRYGGGFGQTTPKGQQFLFFIFYFSLSLGGGFGVASATPKGQRNFILFYFFILFLFF
jgi:hypothetical protein